MVTATFTITAPGASKQRFTTQEDTKGLAETVGRVNALQAAGWTAYVYGEATVTHVESGRSWTISCRENNKTAR
jgi:hypothetical protein